MARYKELDSVRGVAAGTVLLGHGMKMFAPNIPMIVTLSPLYFFWSAYEAVIFFFVLSGFVLGLSSSKAPVSLGNHFLKRMIRIYVPYLVAILFTFVCFSLFRDEATLSEMSQWANGKWNRDLTTRDIVNHIVFLGDYDTSTFNPSIWYLVQYLRISLFFPFLLSAIRKIKVKHLLWIGILLSGLTGLNKSFNIFESVGYNTGIFDTLHFTNLFAIGSIAAIYKEMLIEGYQKLSNKLKVGVFAAGMFLYIYSRAVFMVGGRIIPTDYVSGLYVIWDIGLAIASVMLIILIISSTRLSNILSHKWLLSSGKLSFSVYLYHMPVYLTVFTLLNGKLNNWLILVIAIALSYVMAYLSWKFVEGPSARLARKVSQAELSKENLI